MSAGDMIFTAPAWKCAGSFQANLGEGGITLSHYIDAADASLAAHMESGETLAAWERIGAASAQPAAFTFSLPEPVYSPQPYLRSMPFIVGSYSVTLPVDTRLSGGYSLGEIFPSSGSLDIRGPDARFFEIRGNAGGQRELWFTGSDLDPDTKARYDIRIFTAGGGADRSLTFSLHVADPVRFAATPENDWHRASSQADIFNGGAGFDTVTYRDADKGVTVSLLHPFQNTGNAAGDVYHSIERIRGSDFDDLLIGGKGFNIINGRGGADVMSGGGGRDLFVIDDPGDVIAGELHGEGNIVASRLMSLDLRNSAYFGIDNAKLRGTADLDLTGDDLDNRLRGNDGDNRIMGLAGADTMTGRGGADTFVFRSAGDSGLGDRRDVIRDFTPGVDRINLSRIDANGELPGRLTFSLLPGRGDAFTGVSGELRWRFDGDGNTIIAADIDGDRHADFEILMIGRHHLDTRDFIL
jgi:hypothetical protein